MAISWALNQFVLSQAGPIARKEEKQEVCKLDVKVPILKSKMDLFTHVHPSMLL